MIERMNMPLAGLPPELDGLTVAVISDIHLGAPGLGLEHARLVVRQTNAAEPDIIVLLGDVVHSWQGGRAHLPPLADLRAPEGVWACLGNHEHGFIWVHRYLGEATGPPVGHWRRVFGELGIELLVNEARPLRRGGARAWIVGVDDAYSGADNLSAALREARTDEVCLAITHHPNLIDDPLARHVDLLLAGHTHGGQVHVPVIGPVHVSCRRPRQRAKGLVRANGTVMYVTRGVGEGLPLRLGCPRELPVITLRAAPAADDTPTARDDPRAPSAAGEGTGGDDGEVIQAGRGAGDSHGAGR